MAVRAVDQLGVKHCVEPFVCMAKVLQVTKRGAPSWSIEPEVQHTVRAAHRHVKDCNIEALGIFMINHTHGNFFSMLPGLKTRMSPVASEDESMVLILTPTCYEYI